MPTGADAFTVGDLDTAHGQSLVVTATSDNPALVPLANIMLGGTDAGPHDDGDAGGEPERDGDDHGDGVGRRRWRRATRFMLTVNARQ